MNIYLEKDPHMGDDARIDSILHALARQDVDDLPPGFMDGMWQRAGAMIEIGNRRRRLALFIGIFVVGLGAGIGTTRSPAYADTPEYQLIDGAQLSPSALLHVEP